LQFTPALARLFFVPTLFYFPFHPINVSMSLEVLLNMLRISQDKSADRVPPEALAVAQVIGLGFPL